MKVTFIQISIIILATSCASIDSGKIAPGYKEAFISIKDIFIKNKNTIDPEIIKNIPYASALVSFGNGPNALMILESKFKNDFTWVSADGVFIVSRDGVIIKTAGLNHNLTSSLVETDWKSIDFSRTYSKYISFDQPYLKNMKVEVTYEVIGKEDVLLHNSVRKLLLIEQTLKNDYLGWEVKNKYWLDDKDFVFKSEQYISPKLPKVFFEVTKKPA